MEEPNINNFSKPGAVIQATEASKLSCSSSGFPQSISYTMYKNNKENIKNDSNYIVSSSGNYTCIVQNLFLEKRLTVFVNTSGRVGKLLRTNCLQHTPAYVSCENREIYLIPFGVIKYSYKKFPCGVERILSAILFIVFLMNLLWKAFRIIERSL